MKKYHIETMGCQMNERDSETIAGLLEQLGYVCATPPDEQETAPSASLSRRDLALRRSAADIIVINTCSVRENADNRFFGVLGQIKKAKEADSAKLVAVCGCMLQQEGIRKEIEAKFPWVDIVFGTHNIGELPQLIEATAAERERGNAWHIIDDAPEIVEGLPSKRAYPFKAFVNIIYGCNNFCTYCIVPYTRGREKSRTSRAIIDEVQALCADGVKEITLLGQNVNSYSGACENGSVTDFPDLLKLVSATEGLERLRFMTSHPKDLSDKMIALFATLERLSPSIHLPVQSGSTEVLRRMNRHYSKDDYLTLVRKLREANPAIVITTDLIVGFPGETDADFEETMDIIERARFDSAFTFLYSPRSGTPAAAYENQIAEDVKHRRFDRMTERLNAISLEKNRAYNGKVVPVLAEGGSKKRSDMVSGRTPGGKLVSFHASITPDRLAGHTVDVRITSVGTFSLTGEMLSGV